MKLLDILLEILRESKPIKLDKSVFPQMEKIYDKAINLDDENTTKTLDDTGAIFLGYVKFKNSYNNKPEEIEVWLYKSSIDGAVAAFNMLNRIVIIYYNALKERSRNEMLNSFYHELVHAVDPKISNKNILSKLHSRINTSKDSSDDYIKYLKDPREFDAFSSSFAKDIEASLEKLPEENKKRLTDSLKIFINHLLGTLRKYPNSNLSDENIDTITGEIVDAISKELVIIKDLGFDGEIEPTEAFIYNMLYYLNKPSLFKKYIQRLSTLL